MKFIDMHCDTLMKFANLKDPGSLYENNHMVDFKRMKEAGALAQFFAIFMLPPLLFDRFDIDPISDREYINRLHGILMDGLAQNSGIIALARNYDELVKNEKDGKMSAFLTLEDGRAVEGSFENLTAFYQMGVRLISLTWNAANCFGSPNSKDPAVMSARLSNFGREAIGAMNDMGIIIDVSHLSDGGFMDVAKLSRKPFVASHSNCRSLSPHQRNMTDEMIKLLAEAGGVAGINFGPEFLNEDIQLKDSRIARMSEHIQHMKKVGGIECVGLGSDFDGISGNFELSDISKMGLLFDQLSKDGFTEDEIEKIAYKNALRVIKDSCK